MQFKIDNLPKEYQDLFIADGGIKNPNNLRSPWLDAEERKRSPRDYYCNVWGSPYGSSDSVFDHEILAQVKNLIREPEYKGTLNFSFEYFGDFQNVFFDPHAGKKNLYWWGPLKEGIPNQQHNYIIACDLSWGKGNSNSVAEIYDVNTAEQVGELADAYLGIEDFADVVVALTEWVGGIEEPFLIWESNGGQGESFRDRVLEHGYSNIYMQTREDSATRRPTDKYGWRSNTNAKEWLLSELNIALGEGLKKEPIYNSCRIYSKQLYQELYDHIFSETGSDIVTSTTMDLSTGARRRHGDRVVAMALCILGCREQGKGEHIRMEKAPYGTFAYEINKLEEQKNKNKRMKKRYLFDGN